MLRKTPNRRHRWLAPASSELEPSHEPRPGHHPMEVYTQARPTQVSLHNQAVEALARLQSHCVSSTRWKRGASSLGYSNREPALESESAHILCTVFSYKSLKQRVGSYLLFRTSYFRLL